MDSNKIVSKTGETFAEYGKSKNNEYYERHKTERPHVSQRKQPVLTEDEKKERKRIANLKYNEKRKTTQEYNDINLN